MSSSEGGGGISAGVARRIARSAVRSIFGGYGVIATLRDFAQNPLRFLRGRVIPPVLGAIFGFVFDLAAIISRPFQAVIGALATLSASLTNATQAVTRPIGDALALSANFVVSLTSPLGPLQPFAVGAVAILVGYGVIVVSIRLARALADAIPILSGVETFLFG